MFLYGLQFLLAAKITQIEDTIADNADKPNEVDAASDPLKHFYLHAFGIGSPVQLQQSIYCSNTMIEYSSKEDSQSIQGETNFAAWHDSVDTKIEQAYHVHDRHQKSTSTNDS